MAMKSRSPLRSKESLRVALAKACYAAGGQSKWAAVNDVSAAYVSDVIAGQREPGEKILKALKMERVTYYRRTGQ